MGKIAVLGSNSFIAGSFIAYLLENTEEEIIGISRSDEKDNVFSPYTHMQETKERFRFFKEDIKNTDKIIEILDREKPEAIVNFVGQAEVNTSWLFPEQWFETNTLAIIRLAQELRKKDYLKKYLSFSSPEVYGSMGENTPENDTYKPTTPYAVSKLAGDLFLKTLYIKEGFPVVFTRAANVYGPHQSLFRVIPKVIVQCRKGEKITLNNAGRSKRGFIHSRDIADAVWKVLQNGKAGEVYHLSRKGELISMKELVEKICARMELDFNSSVIVMPENPWRDAVYSLDSSKAMNELGWEPKISLDEGIEQTIEWIEKNWDKIKDMPLEYEHKA